MKLLATAEKKFVGTRPDLDEIIALAQAQARRRPVPFTSDPEQIWKYVVTCLGYPEQPLSEKIEGNAYEYSRFRLRFLLGRPEQYLCFDCNSAGDRWSYDYCDPNEYVRPGKGTRYSIKVERYVARCFHCQYQHNATEGKGYEPYRAESCDGIHARITPLRFVDNYEFKFCRTCGTYRRTPRKDYHASHQYPAIGFSKALSIEI